MLFVHDADHLFAPDLERGAGGDRGGRRQTQPRHCSESLLAHKVARCQQRDGGFLADLRNDRDLGAALLKIEDAVRRVSLGKEGLFWLQIDNSSTKAGVGQKGQAIRCLHVRNFDGDSFTKRTHQLLRRWILAGPPVRPGPAWSADTRLSRARSFRH